MRVTKVDGVDKEVLATLAKILDMILGQTEYLITIDNKAHLLKDQEL